SMEPALDCVSMPHHGTAAGIFRRIRVDSRTMTAATDAVEPMRFITRLLLSPSNGTSAPPEPVDGTVAIAKRTSSGLTVGTTMFKWPAFGMRAFIWFDVYTDGAVDLTDALDWYSYSDVSM